MVDHIGEWHHVTLTRRETHRVASDKNPSTSLRRLILGQSVSGTAVPMLLFSDDTIAGAGADDAGHPENVARAAAELGLDPDELSLFSYDAYRLQSALGTELAP